MSQLTPDAVLREHQLMFEEALASGSISPVIFPHHFAPLFILILTLMIPWPRLGVLKYMRYLSFSCIAYLTVLTVNRHRTLGLSSGYGVGLIQVWLLIWSATLLVFNNPQQDFSRIERPARWCYVSDCSKPSADCSGSFLSSISSRRRGATRVYDAKIEDQYQKKELANEQPEASYHFRWQPFPGHVLHRFYWTIDLVFNFRGPGWNWRISALPPLPDAMLFQQDESSVTEVGLKPFDLAVAKSMLWRFLKTVAGGYLTLDVLRLILTNDPYFLGAIDSPSPYLSALDPESYSTRILALLLRQGLSLITVIIAVKFLAATFWTIYLSSAILCSHFHTWIALPVEEPWLYPNMFGPCLPSIFDSGLAGAWSGWWHQIFRFAFVSAGKWLMCHLPTALQRKRDFTRSLRIFVAFFLSGILHSMGSYTHISHTRPFSGPFLFFALQAPGILFQTVIAKYLNGHSPFRVPRWLRRAGNLAFVVIWFCITGPLAGDDLARCGIWLLGPVPFSLVNYLGFGHGEGSRRWTGQWVQLWTGERWWERGILIL